jgi:GNAT superfamily N-acetyltransferase
MVRNLYDPRDILKAVNDVLLHESCRKGWKFYAPARPESLGQQWAKLVEGGVGACYALVDDGRYVGFLLGLFVPCVLTGIPQALETFWMVLPGHRSGGQAVRLLEAFEAEAWLRRCRQIIVGNSAFVNPKAMRRFYLARGYVLHAEAFRKEV